MHKYTPSRVETGKNIQREISNGAVVTVFTFPSPDVGARLDDIAHGTSTLKAKT